MTTSISTQLKNYFNNIEFIKNGEVLGIKPIDKAKSWENFEDNLFQLMENINIENAKNLIPIFVKFRDNQEREFKELGKLKNYLAENNYDKDSVSEAKFYIAQSYPDSTELKIINWKIAEKLNLTETFVNEFISLMNFRLNYAYRIVKCLDNIVKDETKPQQSVKTPESIESKEPKNPYPTIFVTGYAYEIFIEWNNKFKDNINNHKANYSFLIRKMIKDGLMFDVKFSNYLTLLNKYNISIDKIKPLAECDTKDKTTIYLDTKSTINTRYNITS